MRLASSVCSIMNMLWPPMLLAIFAVALGQVAESGLLILAAVTAFATGISGKAMAYGTQATRAISIAALLALVWHLLNDDFHYHFVWLYSAAEIPWYLKVSNCWGGDEGTLLFMTAFMAQFACRLTRYDGWAARGALVIAAVFAVGTMFWNSFAATPEADLARIPYQGMNAHLTKVWMAIHPPLVFASFSLLLAPVGGAFQALVTGNGDWILIARRYFRLAWLILSAGLAAGMWWAYQDFTYGQIWHWDPVQTSVFVIWALVTAIVHGLRTYHPNGSFGRILPFLAILSAAAVLGSMAITRNTVLASSHRYLGDSSFPLLAGLASIIFLGALVALGLSLRRTFRPKSMQGEQKTLIAVTIFGFAIIAFVSAGHIAHAYINAYLDIEPARKPFMAILTSWGNAADLPKIIEAYAQSTVDTYALNRWLVPMAAIAALVGGHRLFNFKSAKVRWLVTLGVTTLVFLSAFFVHPVARLYSGSMMTSNQTREIMFSLDLLLGASLYFALAGCVSPFIATGKNYSGKAIWSYFVPVGMVHFGVMLALVAVFGAKLLDRIEQKTITYPTDLGQPVTLADGYSLTIGNIFPQQVADGAISESGTGFHSIGEIQLNMSDGSGITPIAHGSTLYRDSRAPTTPGYGAMREICRMIDYRYARLDSDEGIMLDPFIHRGLWQDMQVWLPPVDYIALHHAATTNPEKSATVKLALVVKTFPLMTFLWLGLVLTILAALVLTVTSWRQQQPER